jgi:MYXO-CTERM domain-containing protein
MWGSRIVSSALAASAFVAAASAVHAGFVPWDDLVGDNWIKGLTDPNPKLTMHTANGGDYMVGFDAANGVRSRGMNALRFISGGAGADRRVCDALTGSFSVQNSGNARPFRDVLILVSIGAPSLPADFSMSLGVAGQPAYAFDVAGDFGFYDHPAWDSGRPSGYYSATSPRREGISYAFQTGMVTVYAAKDVNLAPGGGTVTFDYSFAHLPGTAVFSVYGYDADIGWIYHTNRAVADANQPALPVSTFEVTPEPSALALAGLGAAAVWRRRARCRGQRP